jgi:hypothetical protein
VVRYRVTKPRGGTHRSLLDRNYPHHVALPAEALQGSMTRPTMCGLAKDLGGTLSPYHLSRGGRDLRVFCFPTAEAAQTFAERFGGEVLPGRSDGVPG